MLADATTTRPFRRPPARLQSGDRRREGRGAGRPVAV